ncbi:MAG: hypothetical protein NEA02_07970 [Thermoanaerobaculia bacterium]|nr:hypothetical protein [Thermoanaerobaculia bacterium]
MKKTFVFLAALPLLLLAIAVTPRAAAENEPTTLRGEAILGHPAGKLAIQTAELLAAGKVEEAIRLRTSAEQADWKGQSAGDRKDMTARMKERAPNPKAFAEAIRTGGELILTPVRGRLSVPMGAAGSAAVILEIEGGKWRITGGPMLIANEPEPGKETRIQGIEILKHPVGELALKYADALHAGGMDAAMKLASTKAQADWKTLPASERAESTAFRKKMTPKKDDLESGIKAGGILIIEDDARAMLNVVKIEQKSKEAGVVDSSSTTIGIPFVLEGGQWKLAR